MARFLFRSEVTTCYPANWSLDVNDLTIESCILMFQNLVFKFYDGYVKSVRPINVRRLLASDSDFVKDCKEQQMLLVPTLFNLSCVNLCVNKRLIL